MVAILGVGSLWMQLALCFFFLSGVFADLLLVRLCLLVAYAFLLAAGSLGLPLWPALSNPGYISLDLICWCVANIAFHGHQAARLLWEERPIAFPDPDQRQLWRLFWRRGGMGRLEFLATWRRCRLRCFAAGDTILDHRGAQRTLALVVEGLASFSIHPGQLGSPAHAGLQPGNHASFKQAPAEAETEVEAGGAPTPGTGAAPADAAPAADASPSAEGLCERDMYGAALPVRGRLYSGAMFDQGLLNVLGIFVALELDPSQRRHITADTDCLVALWDLRDLNYLATEAGPAVAHSWRAFTMCQMGLTFRFRAFGEALNSRNELEPPEVLLSGARSTDLTDPLSEREYPRVTWRSVLAAVRADLALSTPPGLRHMGLPVHGSQASRRVKAILRATNKQVSSRTLDRLMGEGQTSKLFAGLARLRTLSLSRISLSRSSRSGLVAAALEAPPKGQAAAVADGQPLAQLGKVVTQ